MTRVGVNGWLVDGPGTGSARYLRNVVSRWGPDVTAGRVSVTLYDPTPIDGTGFRLPDGMNERCLAPRSRMLIWENACLGPRADDDVLFCPSYSRPIVVRAPTVVAMHDATCQQFPNLFGRFQRWYNALYRWSARHATLIVTSTAAARDDIAQLCGAPIDRIRVVPLAAADMFRPIDDDLTWVRERFLGEDRPFFLTVGKTTGRRRVPQLLEAFSAFKRETHAPHRLILVGPAPTFALQQLVEELSLTEDVVHSGFVSDDELNGLYNGADALVCPSVYETVSLPILEAQAVGTAVICVDSAGAREITGGSALFIPRLTVEGMATAMARLARDAGLRDDLSAKGLTEAERFSWMRTARETLDVCEEAAHMGLEGATP